MLKSLKDILKVTQVLTAQSVTATTASSGVDNANFGSTMFIVDVGAAAAGMDSASDKFDIVVQHSDVDVSGSYANCADADIFDAEDGANGVAKALDGTADASNVHLVHYRGNKRYTRIRIVETGTVSAPISVIAVQGHGHLNPAL